MMRRHEMNIVNVGYDSTNYDVLADSSPKLLIDVGWSGTLPKLQHACKRMGIRFFSALWNPGRDHCHARPLRRQRDVDPGWLLRSYQSGPTRKGQPTCRPVQGIAAFCVKPFYENLTEN